MHQTKVLFLIHTLQVGGAEKALVNLVNNLNPKKFDITVMTVVDTGAFRHQLAKNIHYKTIIKLPHKNQPDQNKSSGNLLQGKSNIKKSLAKLYQFAWRHANLKKLYKEYITERYDVEVAFLEGISAKIIANSDNKQSKKIAWIHVDMINEPKTALFFKNHQEEKIIYEKFDQIAAVSNIVKKQFEKKFDYDPHKVHVIYNPVNSSEIRAKANQKVPKQRFTICSVGRLSRQKGYDRLLQTVHKLNNDNLDFDVWVIGVGAEKKNLQRLINQFQLENVHLLGYKENPYPYVKSSDLYICSSRAEGFSTAVTEAIILNTPVVSTSCSGAKEILGDSEYGLICQNSTESLYSAMKKILQDQKTYQFYIEQVKKRAPFFDMKKSMRKIETFLEATA